MNKMIPEYRYKAYVENVLDGDSADMVIDLGFKISIRERIRFLGIDTPETRSTDPEEKRRGLEAKEYVKQAIQGKWVALETTKQGKFGRYLGKIYYMRSDHHAVSDTEICINDELIENGMAKSYSGGKRG